VALHLSHCVRVCWAHFGHKLIICKQVVIQTYNSAEYSHFSAHVAIAFTR